MSNMTDVLESNIITHLFRTGSWTKPTALRHKLYTATPGETGGGTEVSAAGYAFVAYGPLDASFPAPVSGDGHTENTNAITYGAPTAAWGTIVATGISDQADVLQLYAPLTQSKTVNNGDAAPSFAAGAQDWTFA